MQMGKLMNIWKYEMGKNWIYENGKTIEYMKIGKQ